MKRFIFSLPLFTLLLLSSCYGPMPENNNIPYAAVNFVIDCSLSGSDNQLADGNTGITKIYDSRHPAINSNQYGKYGFSGVAVTRAIDNQLYAFDICCPYEVQKDIKLTENGFFLTCPKCGSEFEIGNGYGIPHAGPAKQPLKAYKVLRYADEKYRITNF